MAAKQLSDGNPDGTVLGQSTTDLIAFFGGTPVDQPALVTNTSGTLGNTNAAVSAIITALVSLGLMAGS
jgi:hypothetical protein